MRRVDDDEEAEGEEAMNKVIKEKVDEAREAICRVFGDISVSQEETLEAMQELEDYVTSNIDALKEGISRRKR